MRVVLVAWGSRGDVGPVAALSVQLRERGARVRVCAPPDFAPLFGEIDLPFSPLGDSVRERARAAVRRTSTVPLSQYAAQLTAETYQAVEGPAADADAIVVAATPPTMAGAQAVAEMRGIPYASVAYSTNYLPSSHHPPPIWPGQVLPEGELDNLTLWRLNAEHIEPIFGPAINGFRTSVGLPPADGFVRDHLRSGHVFLASDPVLGPWPGPASDSMTQTGAWIRPDDRPLPADVERFLDAGDPPVYAEFGSMPLTDAAAVGRASIEAVRRHGRRVLLGRGWADLELIDDGGDALAVGEVNQQALFRRVAAVVHHGGAGTTVTTTRAAAPQVIVPQVADQTYWGARITELGIGVRHEGRIPTAESLAAALDTALAPPVAARAREIAPTIHTDGAAVAAAMIVEGPL